MKLVTFVLLLAFTGGTAALKCYTCSHGTWAQRSTNTDQCRDPFDVDAVKPNVLKLDCSDVAKLASDLAEAEGIDGIGIKFDTCAKTTGTVNGVYVTARTCFSTSLCPERNGCASRSGATMCCCDTDYCNGASGVAYNVIITLTVIAVASILTV